MGLKRKCKNCNFYEDSFCRFNPPNQFVEHGGTLRHCLPKVKRNDWCGRFEAVEKSCRNCDNFVYGEYGVERICKIGNKRDIVSGHCDEWER